MKRNLLVVVAVSLCANLAAAPKEKSAAKKESNAIKLAESRIINTLFDPESARFRNEIVRRDGTVCGEFNGKNRMGGYSGFRRYIVTSDRVLTETEPSTAFDFRWLQHCEEDEGTAEK